MNRKKLALLLSFLAWSSLTGCSRHEPEPVEHHDDDDAPSQVKLTPEQFHHANLRIEQVRPATIKTTVAVYGKVAPNEEKLAHVMPRFTGIVKAVRKRLGDTVGRGEVLAQIESNESFRSYDVIAEIAGTIITRDITLGELVKDDKTIFTIADLATVWIDLNIFRRDFGSLALGAEVEFHTGEGHVAGQQHIHAKVDYISPFGSEGSQTMLARCVVPNPKGDLRPGLYVDGEVVTGQIEAETTVENGAIQTVKDTTVVFVLEGETFEARAVQLGAKDNERVAIVSGLRPNERYVAENSFVLKTELGKGEAEHEH